MAFIATPESIAALGLTRLRSRTLSPHHFWMMIGCAAVVHALILLVMEHWPTTEPEFTPRTIQIHLGSGRHMQTITTPSSQPASSAKMPVATMPLPKSKPAAKSVVPKPSVVSAPKPTPKPLVQPVAKSQGIAKSQPKPMPIVAPLPPASERKRPAQNPSLDTSLPPSLPASTATQIPIGSAQQLAPLPQLGSLPANGPAATSQAPASAVVQPIAGATVRDGTPEAQLIRSRYEQTVSQWLQKYQTYPAAAKMLGQQGQPVLRIRMDRGGEVKYSGIDKSSGYRLIDDAAMAMVKRASPFPKPPANYPGEEKLIEFLIPVAFRIN